MRDALRTKCRLLIVLLLFIYTFSYTMGQDNRASVTIKFPIPGSLILAVGIEQPRLLSVDTDTGDIQILAENQGGIRCPVWDQQGQHISYSNAKSGITVLDIHSGLTSSIPDLDDYSPDNTSCPIGWSINGNNFFFERATAGFPSNIFTYYLLDMETHHVKKIRDFQTAHLIPDLPPPPEITNLVLYDIRQVKRNPVYNSWLALLAVAVDAETLDDIDNPPGNAPGNQINVNVLWNYETGQMLSLDNLFSDSMVSQQMAWSQDGNLLFITIGRQEKRNTHIVSFSPDGKVASLDSAHINRNIESWLGVDNLMLGWDIDQNTNELIYYIGEISDGKWYETEFLQLDRSVFFSIQGRDWHISTSQAEKQLLASQFNFNSDNE